MSPGRAASDPRASRRHAALAWLVFAMSTLVLFLAVWIVLPAPTYPLLILAIGAAEIAPWLIAVAAGTAMIALIQVPPTKVARITLLLSAGAMALSALPLLRFPKTARHFNQAMQATLGDDFLCAVPAEIRRDLRTNPLDPIALFTGLKPGTPRITRGIPFATHDGAPLTLDVYRSPSPGRYPAVVQIYGGAWQRGAPGDNAAFAADLAAHHFVVFAIDYRHAPRWRWPAQRADVRAALTWLGNHAAEYGADAGRVALIGRSSGGQLAMVAAYDSGTPPIRAVVSYYGPVDLREGYLHPPRPDPLRVRPIEENFLGGTPDDAPEQYRDASPITYATHPLPPTLLVYGARDHVVEPRFGALLQQRLQTTGTRSVFLQIPWAEHAFDAVPAGPSGQLALYHTERFLTWALWSSDSAGCRRPRR